jgi:Na+-translocating ferredoxin:NAD+ oxidoreductase RNF subunit RnfB
MLKCYPGDFKGGQASSSYIANVDEDKCNGCGLCIDRCPMSALVIKENGIPEVIQGRCLGCGLCTTVCAAESLALARRSEEDIPEVPRSMPELFEKIMTTKNAGG